MPKNNTTNDKQINICHLGLYDNVIRLINFPNYPLLRINPLLNKKKD